MTYEELLKVLDSELTEAKSMLKKGNNRTMRVCLVCIASLIDKKLQSYNNRFLTTK